MTDREIARLLLHECRSHGHAARPTASARQLCSVREIVGFLAEECGMIVRTAVLRETLVVVDMQS